MSIKSTGVVRSIDDLGRFVIPKEIRRGLGLFSGTQLEIYIEGDRLFLERYVPNLEKEEVIKTLEFICDKEIIHSSDIENVRKAINLIK